MSAVEPGRDGLGGMVSTADSLSCAQTVQQLRPLAAWLARASDDDLWQQDTDRLPAPLAQLRARARHFARQHLSPIAARLDQQSTTPPGASSPLLQEMLVAAGREGWLSCYLPWPIGSMPWRAWPHAIAWQASLVVEEFGAVDGGLMQVLSAHHLGSMPLILSGNPLQIWRSLRPVYQACLSGQPHLMAYAITEPHAGSDVEHAAGAARMTPGVVAHRVPGGWKLRGDKCYVSGGDLAQSFTVFAALEGEDMRSWTAFLVRAQPAVMRLRNEDKLGLRASGTTALHFNDAFVPDVDVIGGLRQGWAINRTTLTCSRIPVGAMSLGLARAATQEALLFARNCGLARQRLIDRQDVQLRLAAMVSEVRAMRGLLWHEARHAWHPGAFHASLCKSWATETAQRVVEQAMELVGEWAVCGGSSLERILRDVRVTRIVEGTTDINRLGMMEAWADQLVGAGSHEGAPGV